jgi:hypothetical protein
MKQFKGRRKLDEIKQIAIQNGWKVNDFNFKQGSDFLHFDKDSKTIAFNTFNGQFHVLDRLSDTVIGTHLSENLDNEKWYSDILDMFYVELTRA